METSTEKAGFQISPGAADDLLPTADGARFVAMVKRGELELELYAPRGRDTQQPHSRDELYFIVRGQGDFFIGRRRHAFAPGDALFVPAGVEHRFENFADDFLTWVVFYGPEGGDVAEGTELEEPAVKVLG